MSGGDGICIVGAACRLPGAPNERAFADVLTREAFTVGTLPADRWPADMLFHPDPRARGSAYTFAGGYLPAPYDFDIGAFGVSPREAAQMDPQQRLLAELVWEALEDARIAPDALAGEEVGVYIGVSALDHANLFGGDPGGIESHFMSGNTLSIVANRISYLFDLKGPSLIVDTACSSSLVAVDRAAADLRSGRIGTAIVGGVNMLLSPLSFVGFSRAAMLSPTGACRPFSADGDGYVRSEGGVVFVLRRADVAEAGSVRATIAGSAVNSDGRTSGIALPSLAGQRALLERAYGDAGIAPEALAFVEAHGTGTAVGDPIEAGALGAALGRHRGAPLPIGSVKSNIGHLEPAAGVAGMMKALIALEQRRLPATLHLDRLNPDIDFAALNLAPARAAIDLGPGALHCGVSSFGFGGTNAHVILSSAPPIASALSLRRGPEMLVLSTHCREALAELAGDYAARLEAGAEPGRLASAVARGRALLRHRAALPLAKPGEMADALRRFATGQRGAAVMSGHALPATPQVCFVYNGNGSQWVGMGRAAYAANRAFADAFDAADAACRQEGLDDLAGLMHAADLADRLGSAACAQPLIFAIQAGITAALAERGLRPAMVVGHSVGEIAAAHAAGILSLDQAARILAARARSQEVARGLGGMATLAASRADIAALIDDLGLGEPSIAADNAPASVTVSGPGLAIAALLRAARRRQIPGMMLKIDYPYHSPMLARIEADFRQAAGALHPAEPSLPMISTVTGKSVGAQRLDADYWWRNIRQEVLFRQAIATAAGAGGSLFVEIGARSILAGNVGATVEDAGLPVRVIASLGEDDRADADPIATTLARAIAEGLAPPRDDALPVLPIDRAVDLPAYPWQRRTCRHAPTAAAVSPYGEGPRHPLIGARMAQGAPEWRSVLDAGLVPYLADHAVGGERIVPATALAEMALAVARAIFPAGPIGVEDFDILQPMVLPAGGQREVSVRYAAVCAGVEIYSRIRFAAEDWVLCARGRLVQPAVDPGLPPAVTAEAIAHADAGRVYARASASGIDYGPAFQLLQNLRRDDDELIEVALAPPPQRVGRFTAAQILHPASLDAAFHGLFDLLEQERGVCTAWLPTRFERLLVWRDGAAIASATLVVDNSGSQRKTVTVWLRDEAGAVVARLDRGLLRAVVLSRESGGRLLSSFAWRAAGRLDGGELLAAANAHFAAAGVPAPSEGWHLLHAHMRAAGYAALLAIAGAGGLVDAEALISAGRLDPRSAGTLRVLLAELAEAGLLTVTPRGARLSPDHTLPAPEVILASFAEAFPTAAIDLALSAQAGALLADRLADAATPAARAALLDRGDSASLLIEPAFAALVGCVAALARTCGATPLHVVAAGGQGSALVARLAEACAGLTNVRLSLATADSAAAERALRRLPPGSPVEIIDTARPHLASADVVVALVEPTDDSLSRTMRQAALLREDGVLLAAGPVSDNLAIFQRGSADAACSRLGLERFFEQLPEAGLADGTRFDGEWGSPTVVAARKRRSSNPLRCAVDGPSTLAARLTTALHAAGVACGDANADDGCGNRIVAIDAEGCANAPVETLGRLRHALIAARDRPERPRCWVAAVATASASPEGAAAVRAFTRVAINEMPELDLRFVEVCADAPDDRMAAGLARLFTEPGAERELRIGAGGLSVARLSPEAPLADGSAADAATAIVLQPPRPGMLEDFRWSAAPRRRPGPGEIEVEVAATGLNFRDVMLAMGLLSDDVLDEGLAGAVHGLECAGRVVALGEGVTGHAIGDAVVGFGRESFASHIVAPRHGFVALPAGLPIEAAAGLPVAFTTAWYALVEAARLAPGERVLIHGGAGGVGLAAIQIARAIGAEVIATVSSPDKAALARLYGADHIHDSRSLAFVEHIRAGHGGVDVVLNSLSGEAMRASLQCLRPRGRFVELGKRDYVDNSLVGLRGFRRNISYFGVDLDQLMALDPALTARGLGEVFAGLADGRYLPLPVMTYRAAEIGEAFRLMQSAGHIGKIVVTPPPLGSVRATDATRFAPGEGVQLLVGGTRGFGLATALWLAERGARTIVVASRGGELAPEGHDRVEALRARGITFAVEAVDVADAGDVARLIGRVSAAHGPITGVYHTAVALEDGMIDGLTDEALAAVLAPKARGADNLDRATRGQPVAQFVLYSSISALIGNPGQAAYAAANGYLEGVARRRRAEGLPALAVAWGAIADVGLLAGRGALIEGLSRVSGAGAMQSADALVRLGEILGRAERLADPVVICADLAGSGRAALPLLAAPSFAALRTSGAGPAAGEPGASLAEITAGKSEAEAHRLIAALVGGEVAQILRLATGDIDLHAPIDSLGMDSLMALELRMSLEARYGIELPVMAISAVGNLNDLARRILKIVRGGDGAQDRSGQTETERALIAIHGAEPAPPTIERLDEPVRRVGAGL